MQTLEQIETTNARQARDFTGLPEEIQIWEIEKVIHRLGHSVLGLCPGTTTYLLHILSYIKEAQWREGQPIVFLSIREYARKTGLSERTINKYDRVLIAVGLMHRTNKHARRHGGENPCGLNFGCLGLRMPELLDQVAQQDAVNRYSKHLEAEIRAERQLILGLDPEALTGHPGLQRLRGILPVSELEARLARLRLVRSELEAAHPVDNVSVDNVSVDDGSAAVSGGWFDAG